jgi:3-oxoacyl-[acyl-carrier protein] reductase
VTSHVKSLDGQVAIVTGGARGIGLGIGQVLRAEGASVVIADLDGAEADASARSLSETGEHAIAVHADVTLRPALDEVAAAALGRWGRIDILAANAGIYPHISLQEIGPEQWDRLMAINVRGALFAVQACLPQMTSQNYGRIVFTSSITGSVVGQPGYALYGATKAAMLGLMRSAALETATRGITVNAVLPGNIETPGFDDVGPEHRQRMLSSIPLGILGEPRDVGWAVRFLASEEARYITGQTLIIDGGQVLPENAWVPPDR